MPKKPVPSYTLHKATGQARVIVDGRHVYLGKHGSQESLERYSRLLAERAVNPTAPPCPAPAIEADLTVKELASAYWLHAESYYVKDGKPSGHLHVVRLALRAVKNLYGMTPANQFGPLKLKVVQENLVAQGLARNYINSLFGTIRRMFKWGVANEILPATVYQALTALPGLKAGRTAARETAPVAPVEDAVVEATLPHLRKVVADLIQFQRLTGCRPGEARLIRPVEIDRSDAVWVYRPASHKTEHHGRERVILIGPKAQAVLLPYLLRDAYAHCFCPAESEAKRKAERRSKRKSRVQPSQQDRSTPNPNRRPGAAYGKDALNNAIKRACAQAFGNEFGPITAAELMRLAKLGTITTGDVIRQGVHARWRCAAKLAAGASIRGADWYYKVGITYWSANQLRHSAATEIRKRYGLEAAQVILGHSKADVTQIYAERDLAKAATIMQEVG